MSLHLHYIIKLICSCHYTFTTSSNSSVHVIILTQHYQTLCPDLSLQPAVRSSPTSALVCRASRLSERTGWNRGLRRILTPTKTCTPRHGFSSLPPVAGSPYVSTSCVRHSSLLLLYAASQRPRVSAFSCHTTS